MQREDFFSLFAREICIISDYVYAKTICISDRNHVMFFVCFI